MAIGVIGGPIMTPIMGVILQGVEVEAVTPVQSVSSSSGGGGIETAVEAFGRQHRENTDEKDLIELMALENAILAKCFKKS